MDYIIEGIIPAMITPLDSYGKINKISLKRLIDYLLNAKVHGLFPIGSTGEFYGLDFEQKKEIIELVVKKVNGKVPVYAGTGATTTNETIKLTKMAEVAGVDAVSVLTPMFINPSQEELYEHYKCIADNTNIPVLLYNNPGRTGVNLSADLIVKLSKINNIKGIKDSSGDMTLTGEFIRRTNNFNVLAGRDTLILSTLVYGGKGSITATANIAPHIPVKIYEEFKKGNIEEALKAQYSLAPLRLAFKLGTFPVVMKEGLKMLGIKTGPTLKPVNPLDEKAKQKLKEVLKKIGVI